MWRLWILVFVLQNPTNFADVRLIGFGGRCAGDIQIKYRSQWLAVCSMQWHAAYGEIICRETGCGSYDTSIYRPISSGGVTDLLNKLQCKGTENSLLECSFTVSKMEDCRSGMTVIIICNGLVDRDVVLADGGSPCAGRLELSVFEDNFFSVCSHNFGMDDAQVICNYLGCGDAVFASGNSQFGAGKWPMVQIELRCNGTETDFWKCESTFLDPPKCSQEKETAGVVCSGHRKPRLVGGYDKCSGRLEIQHGETWGTVCDLNLDLKDALVVCRSLKCGDATLVIGGAYFGEGSAPMWQDSYKCQGNETFLWNCATTRRNESNCSRRRAVSVICSGQKGPRLVGGKNACSGRLEVLRGETWGTVCDAYWDMKDAAVVCNHLHCGTASSAPVGVFFGQGTGMIWNDINECRGNEMRLNKCFIGSWGQHQCTHDQDVSVICSEDHWQLRLAGGEGRCDGRVEVYHSGVWGRVTNTLWDFKEADVVCRQLNCGSAVNVYKHWKYGIWKGYVLMSNVSCNGSEPYLWNCNFTQSDNLTLGDDVGVFCSGDIPVRLMNGRSRCAGRVEVYYNGSWGTVCDDAWDLTDAHVVCKEMNCGYAVNATVSSWFGQGAGPIWMDNLNCATNKSVLWQCLSRPWGDNNCIHKEDAGVICSDHRDIRLVNGKNPCQGRLEVFFNGTWGTVCADSFGIENAHVVCSQLNCGSAISVVDEGTFGAGTGPIWLDDIRCRFEDLLLWQCPSSTWGQHNCKHQEDVGIICSEIRPSNVRIDSFKTKKVVDSFPEDSDGCKIFLCNSPYCHVSAKEYLSAKYVMQCPTEVAAAPEYYSDARDLRLVAGFDNCSGRVEVFFRETWGTVCDDSWDTPDAVVVCRQLNCGDPVLAFGGKLFPQGNGTIWMDKVKCKGSESFLWDCQSAEKDQHNCGHREDVGVICSGYQMEAAPFNYIRAFIYLLPCITGSLSVIVSLYLANVLRRHFWDDSRKSQPSLTGVPEPFYEEIDFQESGPRLDSPSQSRAENVESDVDGDAHALKYENAEEFTLPLDEHFSEEDDDTA